MRSRNENRFEILNEYMIGLCSFSLVWLTNFVGDPADKFLYGWVQCFTFGSLIAMNMIAIIIGSFF